MIKKILIAGLMCASLALAQKGGGGGGKGGGGNMPSAMGAAAPTKSDTIATALNLNKDQKKAVKTILDDGAKEATPLRDQMSKSRIVVGEAIGAQKGEDELKQVARTSSDVAAQLAQVEMKTFGKIFATLDDTQKKDTRSLSRVLFMMIGIYRTKNWNE